MSDLYTQLKEFGKVRANESLAKRTTFKIGGPCDFFVSVETTENLVALLQYLDGEGIAYVLFGGGSNMLASDDGFRGVVIHVQTSDFRLQTSGMEVDAGCTTVQMAQESMKAGLTGFEWGVGVPGTIGGAVRGNAGAMGGEMKDVVDWVDVYRDGEIVRLSASDCQFGYRHSAFKENHDVILRVGLALKKTDDKTFMKKAIEHLQYRNKTQPQGWASTGCIFKNPDTEKNKELLLKHFDEQDEKVQQFLRVGKISAGWLVEKAGMRGAQIGNAQVSDKHGNFIINRKGATAQDVQTLIEQIKTRVYDTCGITLEEEIQYIGL